MFRFLPSLRESILLSIIIGLVGILAYGALWFNDNYTLMPIPKEKIESVITCLDNTVACDLIYSSTDEIPSE